MQSLIALRFLFSIFIGLSQEYPKPPQPRFRDPVDYIAWVNATYEGPIKNNAARKYKAAFDAYVAPGEEAFAEKWTKGLDRSDKGGPNTVESWLLANKRSLRLYREATEIKDCYFSRTPTESRLLGDVLQPYLSEFRSMRTLICARVRSQYDSGNVDGAIENLLLLLRSARHLDAQPSMLDHLVSLALVRGAYRTMIDWVSAGEGLQGYDAILRRLMAEETPIVIPRRQLVMEKVICWDALQKMQMAEGQEPLLKTQADLDMVVAEVERYVSPYYPLFAESYAKSRSLIQELAKCDGGFTSTSTKDGARLTSPTQKFLIIAKVDEFQPGMLTFLTSGLWRIAVIHRERIADRNGTYALLAVNAYKSKHGHWPRSLAVAMPGVLTAYRGDPFSGKDLVYRIDGGQPVIYSVGLDAKDDGGRRTLKPWRKTGDEVFLPGQ